MSAFSQKLLIWFDQHGRKNLPWQKPRSAYFVWLSEIMLQQTQVATVIPYFERFVKKFPTIKNLANASQDDVLALWAGLGYYTRGRNLHKTAQIIQEKYCGKFPQELHQLEALPGIGRSTAGAIIAQAFNAFGVILDGNVRRVLCRYHAMGEPVNQASTQEQLWALATQYTPQTRLADYSQAIMDLGATLCTRSKPRCTECPLQKSCEAYQDDAVHLYPAKAERKILPLQEKFFLILQNSKQEILLEQQPVPGIWGGLWSLPSASDIRMIFPAQKNLKQVEYLPEIEHTFSHFKLKIKPVRFQQLTSSLSISEILPNRWVSFDALEGIGLPAPIQRLLTHVARL